MGKNQIADAWTKFWSGNDAEIAAIHAYRDAGSYDEILRVIKLFLLPAACLFTVGFGAYFVYFQVASFFPSPIAVGAALVVVVLIEALFVYFGLKAIREIIFGKFTESFSQIFLCMFMIAAAAFGFRWSYQLSTEGLQDLTVAMSADYQRDTTNVLASAAALDAGIADTKNTQNEALGIKWRGKTTQEAQKIAKNATAIQLEQEKQKTLVLETQAQKADVETVRKTQTVNKFAGWLNMFGGKVEWAKLLFLFCLVLCERILGERKKAAQDQKNGPAQGIGFALGNEKAPYNGATPPDRNNRPFIGFNRMPDGNTRRSDQPHATAATLSGLSVPQTTQDVPQTNGPGGLLSGQRADEAILYHLSRLQKEPANFDNRHAKPETVAKRIHDILNDLEQTLKTISDCSVHTANRICFYINKSIQPKLREHDTAHDMTNIIERFIVLVGAEDYTE